MALQLRRKTHESIVYIDKDSAPRIMPNGEDFILEDIPIGTRVIYPNPPINGLPNREAAIRYAVNHPLDVLQALDWIWNAQHRDDSADGGSPGRQAQLPGERH